jgi:hypothetical protein
MKALILFIVAMGTATPALGECNASLESVQTLPIVQYDPFDHAIATAEIAVDLALPGDLADCRLGLSVAGLMPGSTRQATLGGTSILYRLFLDGNELPNNPDAVLKATNHQLEARRLSIKIEVAAGQIGLAGLYSDPIILRLVDLNNGESQLGPERQAAVDVAMESRAQINLAGSDVGGGEFGFARLDFGVIRHGARRSARIQLRSTAPVTMHLSSENQGALARVGGRGESLPYRLMFDGGDVALSSGQASISRDASPSIAGSSYSLDVEIEGNPDAVPAGEYRDVVVIDVDPA